MDVDLETLRRAGYVNMEQQQCAEKERLDGLSEDEQVEELIITLKSSMEECNKLHDEVMRTKLLLNRVSKAQVVGTADGCKVVHLPYPLLVEIYKELNWKD